MKNAVAIVIAFFAFLVIVGLIFTFPFFRQEAFIYGFILGLVVMGTLGVLFLVSFRKNYKIIKVEC